MNARRTLVAAGVMVVAACSVQPATKTPSVEQTIAAALKDPARPAADRARDSTSKPAEVLSFVGLEPGMTVLDMNAATGWYTEIIARVVGPAGHVIAHNHPGARETLAPGEIAKRYENGRLPNVEQLFVRHNELKLPAESLDLVLMSMVYHDTYWHSDSVDWGPIDRHALLTGLREALRPGGIVAVIDHLAPAGADPTTSVMTTHRIDPAIVKRDFAAAGFELVGESDILRAQNDDYSLSVFDATVVGHTDRFVFRFRKPTRALTASRSRT